MDHVNLSIVYCKSANAGKRTHEAPKDNPHSQVHTKPTHRHAPHEDSPTTVPG